MMFTKKWFFVGYLLGSASIFVYISITSSSDMADSKSSEQLPIPDEQVSKTAAWCLNKPLTQAVKQRGPFWVLQNFVKAQKQFGCDESITLTAPADYRFLDNVPPLVQVWNGPISVALYAPGSDFNTTLDSIAYLRNCETKLVKELVTFHVFFDEQHLPSKAIKPFIQLYTDTYNCTKGPPFSNVPDSLMYKTVHNLTYPINVARNVAREAAQTQLVFPSDIELFPTPNFIQKFLEMMAKRPNLLLKTSKENHENDSISSSHDVNKTESRRVVFVLPVFEILADEKIPQNKTQLQKMHNETKAFLFHEKICKLCHKVIKGDDWIKAPETEDLDFFAVGKRQGAYKMWEPFYVSTNEEPLFDERLTWEGQSNKMSQAYSLCLLDYDFVVLNNVFLTHKPGIKKAKTQVEKHMAEIERTKKTLRKIKEELTLFYGENQKCVIALPHML